MMICVVVLLSLTWRGDSQGDVIYILSFSPLWTGILFDCYCYFCESGCRGEYTGEESDSYTLVLPSLKPEICFFVLLFVQDVGEITQGSLLFIINSRSPLYETGTLVLITCFWSLLKGVIFVHFYGSQFCMHFRTMADDTVVRAGDTTPYYVYI